MPADPHTSLETLARLVMLHCLFCLNPGPLSWVAHLATMMVTALEVSPRKSTLTAV